jgi:3-dehydroquinate dehydratase type I
MKCCISVFASSTAEARRLLTEGIRRTGLVELRLDGIPKVKTERLLPVPKGEVIVTNRLREEGGRFPGPEKDRVGLLQQAVSLGTDYVDLEIRTDPSLRKDLQKVIKDRSGRTRLILSHHDFDGTPPPEELRRRWAQGRKAGADIVKIVTFAKEAEDNLRVLALIPYVRRKGGEIIAFCMGPEGKISRILAPLLGSYLTYVSPAKGRETAPGQLTLSEMKKLWRIVRG